MEEGQPEKASTECLITDIKCQLKIVAFVIRHFGDLPAGDKIDFLLGIEQIVAGVAGKISLVEKKS